eukprot:scaffold173623_cov20-Tisochrysis_lutea.AAC.1
MPQPHPEQAREGVGPWVQSRVHEVCKVSQFCLLRQEQADISRPGWGHSCRGLCVVMLPRLYAWIFGAM